MWKCHKSKCTKKGWLQKNRFIWLEVSLVMFVISHNSFVSITKSNCLYVHKHFLSKRNDVKTVNIDKTSYQELAVLLVELEQWRTQQLKNTQKKKIIIIIIMESIYIVLFHIAHLILIITQTKYQSETISTSSEVYRPAAC